MKALFVELPPFEKYREGYMSDDEFNELQKILLITPKAGDVIAGTGGLRKIRFFDSKRGKGKRGGIRVIYFWLEQQRQFWLFTLYNKNEMSDLTTDQKKILKELLKQEVEARQ